MEVPQETPGKVYLAPNPATDVIRVELGIAVKNSRSITVMDVSGRLQSVKSIRQLSPSLFELNVSTLAKGAYLLKVDTGTETKIYKFLKL
jgi:hypothetical protein